MQPNDFAYFVWSLLFFFFFINNLKLVLRERSNEPVHELM